MMKRFLLASTVLVAALLVAGCAVAGSTSIRSGRAAYNDAIVATNNEQMLAMIVRMRYEEPSGLLAVASVTANIRIRASIGAQFGYGPQSNYSGNLVPLSAGALYEENPTISYTPVQGQDYLRQFLSPLPLDLTVLLLSALGDSPSTMMLLVKGINGSQNPVFLTESAADAGDRFVRIAQLLASLHRRGALAWAEEPGDKHTYSLLLDGQGDAYAQEVTELHELLGLEKPRSLDEVIAVRVFLGVGQRPDHAIELRTRSAYDLFRIAAAAVDVPTDHVESGMAAAVPPTGPVASQIRIHRSAGRPDNALVAVKHHGWWYSIDGTDGPSKQTFRILEAITSSRMADAVDKRAAALPMLTVPVSR